MISPRARSVWAAASIVATLAAAVLLVSRGTRASVRYVSRDALRASFASDTRNLVYRWDPADPRPDAERRAALFEFMYQTYDSTAWIPQSVFDGNVVTQAVLGDVDTIVGEKVGLVLWREQTHVPAYGMAPGPRPDLPLRWTVNCLVCHTAEIDGVAYLGAGTKTFDDLWLGEALRTLTSERWRSVLPVDASDRAVAAEANRILKSHHHDKIDSLTRARSTAFAASHVELFLRPNGSHAAGRGRRPGRHQDPAALAHGGEDAVGSLVRRWQLSRSLSAHGVVDGARKGPPVRRPGHVGHPDDQGRVCVGHSSSPSASVPVRD